MDAEKYPSTADKAYSIRCPDESLPADVIELLETNYGPRTFHLHSAIGNKKWQFVVGFDDSGKICYRITVTCPIIATELALKL